jgi:hypothetical protein
MVSTDPTSGREILLMEAFAYNGQYEVKATGYRGVAAAGVLTNVDFAIGAEDRHISGINLMLVNHADQDTLGLQVVDKDNVLGYGAGAVLKTFGITWNVDHTKSDQGRDVFNFVALIYAGLYIRVAYNSTGATDVTVKLNVLLHKKIS